MPGIRAWPTSNPDGSSPTPVNKIPGRVRGHLLWPVWRIGAGGAEGANHHCNSSVPPHLLGRQSKKTSSGGREIKPPPLLLIKSPIPAIRSIPQRAVGSAMLEWSSGPWPYPVIAYLARFGRLAAQSRSQAQYAPSRRKRYAFVPGAAKKWRQMQITCNYYSG